MNIFEFNSYTEALQQTFHERKAMNSELTLAWLAQQSLIQPSYLTNVLKGRADLNSDQLYRLCDLLNLTVEDYEFLQLLLEMKRTQFDKKRKELELKIKKIRAQQLSAEKTLKTQTVTLTPEQSEKYYLDPYVQLIHIYLTIPKAKKNLTSLAQKFSVSEARMTLVLQALIEIGYVQKRSEEYEVLQKGKHLPRESHLLRPHQHMLRLKSLEQLQALPAESTYSFSATISTTPEVRTRLQAEFLKFLKAAEKLVENHEAEKLYQINFDLFPWEKDEV
jgi:uncharacterized protein (TIGR02147 family)